MATLSYDFTDPLDFSFDTNSIELVGGQLRLKLQSDSGTYTEDFADDVGFTYNSSKTEFSAGSIKQKDQLPTNAVLASTYSINVDISMATFSPLTGTTVGTPTFLSSRMDCTGLQGCRYDNTAIGNVSGTGAIKFKYTPNYSSGPPANVTLVHLFNPSNNNDRIGLTHSPSGTSTLRLWINNSVGTSIYTAQTLGGVWNAVANQTYEFELNWDNTVGNIRVFIDGILHGTLTPGVWTRGTTATQLHVGGTSRVYSRAEGGFEDLILYSTVQHTSGYSSGYTLQESRYIKDIITLPSFIHTVIGTILSYDQFIVTTETGDVRYIIQTDSGIFKYWTGSAWANSNGTYAQANSSSDINTNIGALSDANGAVSVTVKLIWPSGASSASLGNLDINVTEHVGYPITEEVITTVESARTVAVQQVEATQSIPLGDSIGWFVIRSGVAFYWNGSTWINSNQTLAQTSSLTALQANITSLTLDRHEFSLGIVLKSGNQTTTPYISALQFNYTSTLDDPDTATLVFLEGFLYDHDGPLSAQSIEVRPYIAGAVNRGVFHKYEYFIFDTTNDDGYFNGYIFANPGNKQWEFKIGTQSYRVTIPEVTSIDWSQLNPVLVE